MVFSGNLWSCVKEVKPLVVFDKDCCMALEPMQGIGPHLDLICGTRSSFMLLWLPQGPSRFVTVFLGTLCSSIKEDKAPLLFHGKHGIALFPMQGNRDSSRGEGKDLYFFTSCAGNLGYILELWWGWRFKTPVCSAT